MSLWDRINKDIQSGLKDIKQRADKLTDEGKRRYKIFDLKTKVHKGMAELGGLVYAQSGSDKNPLQNTKIKSTIGKIKKLEAEIDSLEGKTASKKAPSSKCKKC